MSILYSPGLPILRCNFFFTKRLPLAVIFSSKIKTTLMGMGSSILSLHIVNIHYKNDTVLETFLLIWYKSICTIFFNIKRQFQIINLKYSI